MKQIFKKVSSLCTVLLMMAVLTLTGVSSVWAADEVDDTVKQTLVTRQRNMKNWKSAVQLSMYVLILRCRMAATSFAPIVSFPTQEAACEAGKKRIF